MDFYTIFKLLHVIAALAWVGGGLTLLAFSLMVSTSSEAAARFSTLDILNRLGLTWFAPSALLTFVFGAITTTFGGMWGESWIILALAGFTVTFLTGIMFIEPRSRKIAQLRQAGRIDEALAAGDRLTSISKFDGIVMLLIVADMVLKPQWSDVVVLAVFAAVAIAGTIVFLLPALREEPLVA
jgi:uncharacterized membrane protein